MHEDVKEQGSCSSCEECSIRIIGESTPLMVTSPQHRSNANRCIILLLFLALLAGITIGIYLMIEDYRWEPDQPYPMVQSFTIANLSDAGNISHVRNNVELISTQGSPCTGENECNESIYNLTKKNTTDMLNFATVYNHQCSNCDNNTIVIALSRINSQKDMPGTSQKQKVEDIIDYSINNGKLTPCCTVSAKNGIDWLQSLADEIQNDMNQKYNCST